MRKASAPSTISAACRCPKSPTGSTWISTSGLWRASIATRASAATCVTSPVGTARINASIWTATRCRRPWKPPAAPASRPHPSPSWTLPRCPTASPRRSAFRASTKRNAWAATSAGWFARWRIASPWSRWTPANLPKAGPCARHRNSRNKEPMANTLIRNGTVVTAHESRAADVLIEGERIKEVRAGIPQDSASTVIDAAQMYVMPGGIDAHTHLDMPFGGTTSADDFETGTRAAAFGGTTCIVDFAIQARGTRMRDALDTWWKKAEGRACIDYGLHMIVTDLGACGLEDMDDMVREGVASFKLFMAYPNVLMVDDATIFKALSRTAKNGALVCMHAENGSVIDVLIARALAEGHTAPIYHALTRPPRAESEAVHRAIAMAEIAGVPVYIVHLTSEDALHEVREARDRGVPAFAETCPQYLLLSQDDLARPNFEGAKYVFTPPLRPKEHQPKLWDGLKNDHLQVVSTDHCPFCFKDQKILGKDDFTKIPNGGPGIENRLQLMYHHGVNQGKLSLNRFVELTSTTPARIFGMYPQKGEIAEGSDADIVLWDPDASYTISANTHHMKVDYSMFEGFTVKGNARTVLSRGEIIVEGDKFLGKPGRGQYLKRAARGGAWK